MYSVNLKLMCCPVIFMTFMLVVLELAKNTVSGLV